MPQSCALICPGNVDLDTFREILQRTWGDAFIEHPKDARPGLQVRECSRASWYVSIEPCIDRCAAINDYKSNDTLPSTFRDHLDRQAILYVRYSDFRKAREILRQLLTILGDKVHQSWLDNDYGLVLPAAMVLNRLVEDEDWDWRSEELDPESGRREDR